MEISLPIQKITKRNMLQKLISIFNVLGFMPSSKNNNHLLKWIAWEQYLPRFIWILKTITNANEKFLEKHRH